MPSQCREVITLGGSGSAAMNSTLLSHHHQNAKSFSYSSLLQAGGSYCTPQAHCRSESTTTTPPLLSSYPDTESWFPAAAAAAAASSLTDSASPAVSQNNKLQRSSEEKSTSLGGTCAEEEVASAAADAGQRLLSQFVGEYEGDAWWPSVGVCGAGGNDQQNGLAQHGISDTKSSRAPSPFPSCTNTDTWPCNDDTTTTSNHPVAVANVDVDLNTPSNCELPSAIAVASVVPVTAKGGIGRKAGPKQRGKSVSAPTSPSSLLHLGVQKRPESQRENHIWSERQRRKGMNYLFSTLRGLLPHPTSKTDKSTVVGEIIKYIQSLQLKLDLLTRKRQHVLATHTLTTFNNNNNNNSNNLTPPQTAFVSNGLTLVDHSNDPTCMTSVTALPLPGSESGLQSYLGSNVGLHVCGLNVFITASSPRGRRGLLQGLLVVVGKYCLEVVNANVSTSTASIFYCLHCQASPEAELLNNSLHSDLQSMITNFEAPF